ncbi:phospholipase D-like domain-containing protein [Nocardioides sp. SLBN-35]|uniref:phospholipase D-like domain-containing protein n=1 Tax=Nocardioides sp. SLBN-35 TaxID=2768445 RepID=UPI0011506BFB|nr:phospholipase D-like domain-containing protein [Nocardioides sp. SLBN-35]TQK70138.1 phospholipase D-like protein [Nocardioides sp. SLBN-35]
MSNVWGTSSVAARTRGIAALAALFLAMGLLVAGPAGLTRADAVPAAATTPVVAKKAKKQPNPAYVVTPGITFNHPFKAKKRGAIQRKIIKTLKNVEPGQTVRVMTWNFDSPLLAGKMIAAHNRGVSVQIIMARGLAREQGSHRSYGVLTRALKKGNADRPKELRSWIRTCSATCRGKGGAMHNKMMLVSKSGATNWIVMQGSGNFTGAAAVQQFNDWTTVTENQALYDGWMTMWNQAKKDKKFPALQFTVPSTTIPGATITTQFAPHRDQVDPPLRVLNKVQCNGAANTANGRTKVRVANAVWGDERGAQIARKVRELHFQGCDVRVVFMMMSGKIRSILAPVPAKQMVYITGATANKFKDRYVHLKGLAVQGNLDGNPNGSAVLSSSENWTQLGWFSDEHDIIFWDDAAMAAKYSDWADMIFNTAPRSLANYVNSADPDPVVRVKPGTEYLSPQDYPFHELEAELN